MGFNTVVVLLNDFQHEIKKSGPLGQRIHIAMSSWIGRRNRMDLNFGAGSVISQSHADNEQVVVVARNSGQRVEDANDLGWYALDVMKACLERHGYKVTKNRKAKAADSPSIEGSQP